jgi:hypothetical protein
MLQDELDRWRSCLTARRFKRSGLDERPSLADFDWRFNPKLPRSACFELHTLKSSPKAPMPCSSVGPTPARPCG